MKNLVIGMVLGLVIMFVAFYPITTTHEDSIESLSERVDSMEEKIVEETLNTILTEPKNIFVMLESHPEWEEIDAVPYSRCYRHLIGTTTVADFIFCQAI